MKTFALVIDIFSAAIAIILLLRLIFVFTDTEGDKWQRSKNWLIGFVLVSLGWTIISQVFHYNIGEFGVDQNRKIKQTSNTYVEEEEEDSNVNSTDVVLPK